MTVHPLTAASPKAHVVYGPRRSTTTTVAATPAKIDTVDLQFRRATSPFGMVWRAEGEEFSYVLRQEGRGWVLRVYWTETVAGLPTLGSLRDLAHADHQRTVKAIAHAYEANVDADTKRSQNRITRAIGWAYEEN